MPDAKAQKGLDKELAETAVTLRKQRKCRQPRGNLGITHDKKRLKCEYCEISFLYNSDLLRHTRTHTGERPYDCKSCHNKFARKSQLVIHTRTHTGEKPYKCEYCEKAFADISNLSDHKRIHTGERPFECQFCDYSAIKRKSIIRHERTHAEEKPYKCKFCTFSTKFPESLKSHEKGHVTGPQSVGTKAKYKCTYCPKVYRFLPSLRYHEQTHFGEKRYKSTFCDYSAIQKACVIIQERRWHAAQNDVQSTITEQPLGSIKIQPALSVQQPFSLTATGQQMQSVNKCHQSRCRACKFSSASSVDAAFHMNALHKLPVVAIRRLRIVNLT